MRLSLIHIYFDHISGPARNLAARIILQYMQELDLRKPMPKLLMGDLNASYDSRCVRILRENLHQYPFRLQDAYEKYDGVRSNTYHRFAGRVKAGRSPIDYIFASAVSYTHLDVYKRQAMRFLIRSTLIRIGARILPKIPVSTTTATVTDGIPPSWALSSMAMGVVTDLGIMV